MAVRTADTRGPAFMPAEAARVSHQPLTAGLRRAVIEGLGASGHLLPRELTPRSPEARA